MAQCPLCFGEVRGDLLEEHVMGCLDARDQEAREAQEVADAEMAARLAGPGAAAAPLAHDDVDPETMAQILALMQEEEDGMGLADHPENREKAPHVLDSYVTYSYVESRNHHINVTLCAQVVVGEMWFLFGGISTGSKRAIDLMQYYNLDTQTWGILETAGPRPSPRMLSSLVFYPPSSIYCFGGVNLEGHRLHDDVWLYDLPSNSWQQVLLDPDKPRPVASFASSGVYVPSTDLIYLYGGINFNEDGDLDDSEEDGMANRHFWSFCPRTREYVSLSGAGGARPPPAAFHLMHWNSDSRRIMLCGGSRAFLDEDTQTSLDLYAYDVASHTWYFPFYENATPEPEHSSQVSLSCSSNNFIMAVGVAQEMACLSLNTLSWSVPRVSRGKKIPAGILQSTHYKGATHVLWSPFFDKLQKRYDCGAPPKQQRMYKLETNIGEPVSLLELCVKCMATCPDVLARSIHLLTPELRFRILQMQLTLDTLHEELMPTMFAGLTEISLAFNTEITDSVVLMLPQTLTALSLYGCTNLSNDAFRYLTEFKSLVDLNLGLCNAISGECVLDLLIGLPGLVSFNLSNVDLDMLNITGDFTREVLFANMPAQEIMDSSSFSTLQYLTVDYSKISDMGLQLIMLLPSLQLLSVIGCKALTVPGMLASLRQWKDLNGSADRVLEIRMHNKATRHLPATCTWTSDKLEMYKLDGRLDDANK